LQEDPETPEDIFNKLQHLYNSILKQPLDTPKLMDRAHRALPRRRREISSAESTTTRRRKIFLNHPKTLLHYKIQMAQSKSFQTCPGQNSREEDSCARSPKPYKTATPNIDGDTPFPSPFYMTTSNLSRNS
ncbi:Hypothetical predicted protein, partial [Pelobates cultripes]